MLLKKWSDLPRKMQNKEVQKYYDILRQKKCQLFLKFVLDRIMALLLLILLAPVFLLVAIWIKQDSEGPIFFRQVRVTRYGKIFRIYKFRTMVQNAEQCGIQITMQNDMRITQVGKKIRNCRVDEIPQLINVLKGEMSFVGTRPEVPKYVAAYSQEMMATLLLPAGVTSSASIEYKDEDILMLANGGSEDIYIHNILPEKMRWNLMNLKHVSFFYDLKLMLRTVRAVL